MAELIEGDWDLFTFKLVYPEMTTAVIQHLRENFYLDEPILKIIGLPEPAAEEFDSWVAAVLKENLSFCAIEKNSGKIAGVRVTGRSCKGTRASVKCETREFKMVTNFLESVENQANIFELYNVEEYANLYFASVEREFRGKGLASEMYNRVLKLLRGSGFKVTKSSFTSPFTRKISSKLGFEEVAAKYFREIQDENGGFPFSSLGEDEFVSVRTLKL